MKNIYDKNKRKKLSITIDAELLYLIDENTTNRSFIINWIIKEHFNKIGKDVSKIKL